MKAITLPFTRQTGPAIVGMLVMFVWSMLVCLVSANHGPFGNADGVLLFGFRVGNISLYCDPFVLGAFASIVTYLWGKIPPSRYRGMNDVTSAIAGIGIFTFVFQILMRLNCEGIFQGIGCSVGFASCLTIIIMTPFGMRGAILSTAICSLGLFVVRGSVPAILFVTMVYIGKWINWWIFNTIRHGFTGAKNALRSSGDAEVVVQQT